MNAVATRRLDLFERALVLAVYLYGVAIVLPAVLARPLLGDLLLLAANCAVVVFVVARRCPEEISFRAWDWLIAVAGTVAPLLAVPPLGPSLLPRPAAAVLTLVGILISLVAKLTLRRNFSIVPARSGIVRGGVYGLVRHPMYAGYLVTHIGILTFGFTVRNLVCYLTCWLCLWLRMGREEAMLAGDASYREYCTRVRYRVVWGLL